MKKNDLMRACPSLCSGRSTPPFPLIRRDIGRFAQQSFFVTFVPLKAVPLPLLTLEGCTKDGVVSPLLTLEGCPKDGVVSPLLALEGCSKDGVVSAPSVVLTLTTETSSDTLPLISCFFLKS